MDETRPSPVAPRTKSPRISQALRPGPGRKKMPGRPDCGTHRLPASPELQSPDVQTSGLPSGLRDAQDPSITGIAIAGRPGCRVAGLPDYQAPRLPASSELKFREVQTSGIPASPELQLPDVHNARLMAGQELQFLDVQVAGLPGSQNVQAHGRTGIAISGSTGSRHDRNCNRQTHRLPGSRAYGMTGIAIARSRSSWKPGITGTGIAGRPAARTSGSSATTPATPRSRGQGAAGTGMRDENPPSRSMQELNCG